MRYTLHSISLPNKGMTKKSIEVDMDDLEVRLVNPKKDHHVVLHTVGVGPCICLVFYGECEGAQFIAMLHWSGFNVDETAADFDEDYFGEWVDWIRIELGADKGTLITLESLFVVGGERPEYDADGKVNCSGTEEEVRSLLRFLMKRPGYSDENYYYRFTNDFEMLLKNFIVKSNDDAINVYANGSGHVFWSFDRPYRPEAVLPPMFDACQQPTGKKARKIVDEIVNTCIFG